MSLFKSQVLPMAIAISMILVIAATAASIILPNSTPPTTLFAQQNATTTDEASNPPALTIERDLSSSGRVRVWFRLSGRDDVTRTRYLYFRPHGSDSGYNWWSRFHQVHVDEGTDYMDESFWVHRNREPMEFVRGYTVNDDESQTEHRSTSAVLLPEPTPLAPRDLAVETSSGFGEAPSATLTWSAPEAPADLDPSRHYTEFLVTEYVILRREAGSDDEYEVRAETSATSTSYATEGVFGDHYEYVVRADNPSGWGETSDPVSFTFPVRWPAPQAPSDLALEQSGEGGSVKMTWSAPEAYPESDYPGYPADSGITGYQILRRVAGSGQDYDVLVADTEDISTSHVLTSSASDHGVEYEYVVKAIY